ncbi:MAG: S-layer homology domain-containing protein [Thermoanaerobaculaceae bacterium]|nr:S-layer homology domain-containing protein [Thermoanaerobaculaceae bacterium]MDI9622559.1 M12 family metallo-peptidase [Acidobacteriota bacterium]NLH09885.1 hypothetical protein [Holophagae bacterium]HPW54539.1 M12 family metallo-peptidase [Thermoanaerobaculaceae bacterium]
MAHRLNWLVPRLIIVLSGLLAGTVVAGDGMWRDISEDEVNAAVSVRVIRPVSYRLMALDVDALQQLLTQVPSERSVAAETLAIELPLPFPDGTTQRFRIVEAPVMAPELARRYPDIRTYLGQGVDDPTATLRCDLTPRGFHAQVLRDGEAVYVDPYQQGDTSTYQSYFRSALSRNPEEPPFVCHVGEHHESQLSGFHAQASQPLLAPSGATLRTYRLALAATGEYTAKVCAPHPAAVACGLAAMVTSMNRVNGVYEREVAIRMVMVADNDRLVYTDGATDPYTNDDGLAMLDQNQANIDAVIGNANYDIGHVFSTGGGGIAYVGVPCKAGLKAGGVTGRSNPVGDPFDIDYVAHEMGHQWGGYHTFNGTTGSCSGNRSSSAAYEPGSGSTIMAYAGICGAENLQPNSDPYFHSKSLEQIIAYSTGDGDVCAVKTPTGNSAPLPNAGPSYTIPMQTPFTLTGSATDPEGDALTYCWEEYDLGSQSPPQGDASAVRPIFRSFNATSSPSRTFPRLGDILAGSQTFGEWMSQRTRSMRFRLTARDNQVAGGGVNWASTVVNVSSNAGPFVVTQPTSGTTWSGGGTATVTWNVANTVSAPVSCSAVDILLSTDGGFTFPTVLASATPNDGSQDVGVPAVTSSQARVKVACSGNIFFDISNPDFTIQCNPPQEFALVAPANAATLSGNVVTLQWSAAGGASGYDVFLGDSADPPLLESTATTSFVVPVTPGRTYHWKVRATNTCGQHVAPATGTYSFSVQAPVLTPATGVEVDITAATGSSSNLNGVLEPGETVEVAPRWRNEGTTATAFEGTLSDFGGPSGASYAIVDGTGRYGTLAAGATGSCRSGSGDCYLLSVANSVDRPAPHWDATVVETLSTGQTRTLTLHIGDSFADVPGSDPGQRFVETIFHHGITSGCAAGLFCPDDPITRWQMVVFLSQSIVGPAGVVPVSGSVRGNPYDCVVGGTSLFTDVQPEDPGCRFVHFIYARGITAGCAPDLYCPGDPVNRWQMAVFLASAMVGEGNPIPVAGVVGGRAYHCVAGGVSLFEDVPAADGGCPSVHYIYAAGVTAGCASSLYCPSSPNTRWQMAVFLTSAFGLELY